MIQPVLCPVCQKQAEPETSPFCSNRCRKIDLMRWWDGRYAITEPLSAEAQAALLLESLENEEAGSYTDISSEGLD
jgi:endogenous inhibitor of DNA gyrase (YacG/DUF329 family)